MRAEETQARRGILVHFFGTVPDVYWRPLYWAGVDGIIYGAVIRFKKYGNFDDEIFHVGPTVLPRRRL